jgi:AAA+ ATPase superfamily predicted ATPase
MSDFIGRENELRALADAFEAAPAAFIPIYGRRRVGKSELILRFLHGRPGIYFLGKKAQAGLQIREFLRAAAAALREPLLAGLPADHWKPALEAVVSRWKGPGKLVLALDEFQWTAEASPELPSVLQECWDRGWKRGGRVLLILCGSYVGFMEREVLGRRSPLFGRRTAQIHLRPFGYRDAARFHPGYSTADRARAYFVCGGIPLYLRRFSPAHSVESNIASSLLDEFDPLYHEPDFLLREELRDVENYYAILLALASGPLPSGEISRRSGIGDRSLHYYLAQLAELGYLHRIYPLTGRPPVPRHVRYALDDPLLRFWFRFVYPNTSLIQQMGAVKAFATLIRPELDAYFGGCFERLCREALPHLYAAEGVTAPFEIGSYWDKTVQIDVVGHREDGWTDLGECKWGAVRSGAALAAELESKVARYPNPRGATIGRRLFTRVRPKDARPADPSPRWHDLADLYAAKK